MDLAHQVNTKAALLHMVDISKAIRNIDAGILLDQAIIVLKKEVKQTLDKLAMMYNGKSILKFMSKDHPTKEIIKTAEVWDVNLIFMGTHGRIRLMYLLVGSIAEYVIRHSKNPVMVVPSK